MTDRENDYEERLLELTPEEADYAMSLTGELFWDWLAARA